MSLAKAPVPYPGDTGKTILRHAKWIEGALIPLFRLDGAVTAMILLAVHSLLLI